MSAWRGQFRLGKALERRANRRKGCYIIIALIRHSVMVRYGTNGNDIRHVARRADRHCIWTGITRRYDNRDPSIPSRHDGLINGILPVVRDRIALKGQR